MSWFLVHDNFDCEPKAVELMKRGVIGLAALGLWTLCGAWCRRKPSPGIVPAAIAEHYANASNGRPRTSADDLGRTRTASDASEIIAELLDVELWIAIDGGYQFNDWDHIYTKDCKEATRKAKDAERKRLERASKRAAKRQRSLQQTVRRTSIGRTSDAGYGRGEVSSNLEVRDSVVASREPGEDDETDERAHWALTQIRRVVGGK